MGDIIHSMVALQFIKNKISKYPNWLVYRRCFSKVLENNPDINNIIKLNLKSLKTQKKIFNSIKTCKKF